MVEVKSMEEEEKGIKKIYYSKEPHYTGFIEKTVVLVFDNDGKPMRVDFYREDSSMKRTKFEEICFPFKEFKKIVKSIQKRVG